MDRQESENHNVIFFDGVCNLCDGFVSFIMGLNPPTNMKIAPLQGQYAEENLSSEQRESLSSVLYLRQGSLFRESTAVLYILTDLKWFFFPLKIGFLIPQKLRDGMYQWVAKNRYRFFGQKETCRLPTEEERAYFLD